MSTEAGIVSSGDEAVKEKLTKAREFKEKGNDHFRQQEVKKALKSYHSGLLYIKGVHQDLNPNQLLGTRQPRKTLSKEDKTELDAITANLQNNIAACLLKCDPVRYERVVECCKEVTQLQPDNVKGWYRLGLAHYNLRQFDDAKSALTSVNKSTVNKDTQVRNLLAAVNEELKKENQKFNDMFKNSLLGKKT